MGSEMPQARVSPLSFVNEDFDFDDSDNSSVELKLESYRWKNAKDGDKINKQSEIIKSLTQKVESLKDICSENLIEIKQLRDENEEMKQTNRSQKEELDRMKSKEVVHEREKLALIREKSKLEYDLKQLRRRKSKPSEIKQLEEELVVKGQEIDRLNMTHAKIEEMELAIKKQNQEILQKSQMIDHYISKENEFLETIQLLEREIEYELKSKSEQENKIKTIEVEMERLKKEIEKLKKSDKEGSDNKSHNQEFINTALKELKKEVYKEMEHQFFTKMGEMLNSHMETFVADVSKTVIAGINKNTDNTLSGRSNDAEKNVTRKPKVINF